MNDSHPFMRMMSKKFPVKLLILGIGISFIGLGWHYPASPSEEEAQDAGKMIYTTGKSTTGQDILAIMSAVEVPAAVLPCLNCHGANGRGKPEGGVVPSDIRWKVLTKSYESIRTNGRVHPPYDEQTLKRAITMGLDPAGNALHQAMPRYRMSREDMDQLIGYLKQLGHSTEPGVSDTTINIGVLLPGDPHFSSRNDQVWKILSAYFNTLNDNGGIYGRRIVLKQPSSVNKNADLLDRAKAYLEQTDIFALTASSFNGVDHQLSALANSYRIPVVGALSAFPLTGVLENKFVFYLYPGAANLGKALGEFALEKMGHAPEKVVILYESSPYREQLAQSIRDNLVQQGQEVLNRSFTPDGIPPNDLVRSLDHHAGDILYYIGPPAFGNRLLIEADHEGWQPVVLIPATLSGLDPFAIPAAFTNKVFMAYPTWLTDRKAHALEFYAQLCRQYNLNRQHLNSQLNALASATILVEAIRQSGRALTREKLIDRLENMYVFQTGLIPPVSYNINKRIGSERVYITAADPEKKEMILVDMIQ